MRDTLSRWLYLLMGLAAGAAATWLVIGPEPPSPLNLALFLILLVAAVTGLLAPLLAWLQTRVLGDRAPGGAAAVRQAFLAGLALALLAWLQLLRLLDGTLLLGVIALVVLLEVFAQSRSR